MKLPVPKPKLTAFFAPVDEHDPGPAPKVWLAWTWLLIMPPGVVAAWLLFLRPR
jgi:hypothetical protein